MIQGIMGQLHMCSNMCVGANTASPCQQFGYPHVEVTRYITESGIGYLILRLPTRHVSSDRQASQNLLDIDNPTKQQNQLVGVVGHTCDRCTLEATANLSYSVNFKPTWAPA